MKIVALDAEPATGCSTASPAARGELPLSVLEEFGEVSIFASTPPELILERARGAEILLTNKVPLSAETFRQLPALRLVSVLATGVNVVDLEAAKAQGVAVCNVPGYSTPSTAQHAFALLLELCHQVGAHSQHVQEGGWSSSPSFSYWRHPLVELDGLTLGVVGYGAIGRRVAEIARCFGMEVLVHTRTRSDDPSVRFVEKDELLESSDVVSLHCPLTELTHHFIDRAALARMKSTAFLINVARGPVVDEHALAEALAERRISAAAVDVLDKEPPDPDHPLVQSPHCLVTPHIAWATVAARSRLIQITRDNIAAFLAGDRKNRVV